LGYSSTSKGYKCYDAINKKSYISRCIIFIESEPYFKKEIRNIPIEHSSHTIEQSHPVLPQIFSLDNLQIREKEDHGQGEVSDDNHDNEEEIGCPLDLETLSHTRDNISSKILFLTIIYHVNIWHL
jgi:hypothetical protein